MAIVNSDIRIFYCSESHNTNELKMFLSTTYTDTSGFFNYCFFFTGVFYLITQL